MLMYAGNNESEDLFMLSNGQLPYAIKRLNRRVDVADAGICRSVFADRGSPRKYQYILLGFFFNLGLFNLISEILI